MITYWEKQVILLTKGHYGSNPEQKDLLLKIFAAHLFDLRIEYIGQYNIRHMITGIYDQVINDEALKRATLTDFVEEFFKYNEGRTITLIDVLDKMLDKFQTIEAKSIDLCRTDIDQNLQKHADENKLDEYIKQMYS